MLIYCITCKVNGKFYIGQTSGTVKKRWADHKANANFGGKHLIARAIRKYGCENFIIEQVVTAQSQQELDALEKLWILMTRACDPIVGYNVASGGLRTSGFTKEIREKAASTMRGRPATEAQMVGLRAGWAVRTKPRGPMKEEHRKKIGAAHLGRKWGEDFGRKISDAKRGKPAHANSTAAVSEALKGKVLSEEHKQKIRDSMRKAMARKFPKKEKAS